MRLITLQNIAIVYIAIWSVSPPLFASDVARIFVALAVFIWIFLEILRPNGPANKFTAPMLLALLYLIYTGSIEVAIYGAERLIDVIQIWIMLLFLIVGQSRRNNLQSLVPVFWSVIAIYPVWLFITVNTLTTTNAHAARFIVRESDVASELTQQGVGGYALVYGTLLLTPALLGLLRNRQVLRGGNLPRPLRMLPAVAFGLIALNLGLGVTLVLTSGFTIAVIALIGTLLSFLLLEKYNGPRFIFAVFVMLVAAIFAKPLLESTLLALQPFAVETSFEAKIRDILISVQSEEASGSAELRMERYVRSLQIFAENPLIGVLEYDNVGKHSQILDGFARWGVIFGGIFVYLVSFPALRGMRDSKHIFGVGLAFFASIIVIFGLNVGFAAAGLMLYIMFPVSLHMLRASQNEFERLSATIARRAVPGL